MNWDIHQVEEKLEEGNKKKSNIRRFLARLLTPIFLEVCAMSELSSFQLAPQSAIG
jgi:hypothetical protein